MEKTSINLNVECKDKAQEIALINKLYESLPQDSYLKNILKGIPAYCERQIECDFAYGPLEELDNSFTENRKLQTKAKDLAEQLATEQKSLAAERNHVTELLEERQEQADAIRKAWNERTETQNELTVSLDKLADQALEILRLKARLFDFMVASEQKGGL